MHEISQALDYLFYVFNSKLLMNPGLTSIMGRIGR